MKKVESLNEKEKPSNLSYPINCFMCSLLLLSFLLLILHAVEASFVCIIGILTAIALFVSSTLDDLIDERRGYAIGVE